MRLDGASVRQLCRAASAYCQSLQATTSSQCSLYPSCAPQAYRLIQTFTAAQEQFVTLNTLRDNPGATHYVRPATSTVFNRLLLSTQHLSFFLQPRRVGRGIGSGLGKTAGRGHKGQKARTGMPALAVCLAELLEEGTCICYCWHLQCRYR